MWSSLVPHKITGLRSIFNDRFTKASLLNNKNYNGLHILLYIILLYMKAS